MLNLIHALGTWKLYKKAGFSPIFSAIPFYNLYIALKIIRRPWWWIFLYYIPVVNNVMIIVLWVELVKSFGKQKKSDSYIVVFTLGLYLFYLNYFEDVKYVSENNTSTKSDSGDWVSAIVFAIVAATIIRTFSFEAYTIPTSSMEKSMMVGDFLFVSKMSYGTRIPMTQFTLPLLHDTVPVLGIPAYVKGPELPYWRLPKISDIKNNDIVVFNYPMVDAPVDKKTNYIKRCIAIAGDSLEIKHGSVYVNGKEAALPDGSHGQFMHIVKLKKGTKIRKDILIERYDITDPIMGDYNNPDIMYMNLTHDKVEKLKSITNIESIIQYENKPGSKDKGIFPDTKEWNADNFGPIYVPKQGVTVELNSESLPFYERVIKVYEANDLKVEGDKIFINGELASSYTFKQNYYWMMGDNRHNSLDSRYWGYVPEDHVVGKPTFVWMSINQYASGLDKFRWERIMTGISDQGKINDHKILVAILIILSIIANYFLKKRKLKKSI